MKWKMTPWLFATSSAALLVAHASSFAESPLSPQDSVRAAYAAAQRASDVEAALRGLEADPRHVESLGARNAEGIIAAARAFRPIELPSGPQAWAERGLDLAKAQREGDRLVQTLSDGTRVTFTVDPDVQRNLEKMLDDRNVAHSGVVLMDPDTGRVRAFVSHTEGVPAIPDLAGKSTAPSASVFKVITAAALIEEAGIDPEKKVCYHGGRSRLTAANIEGSAKRDHKCANLEAALAWSINSVMAKLAYKHLSREELAGWAERFAYNREIPFEFAIEQSTAEFVEDPIERARTAAGFWHTYMSPLHGAMIGGALANDGVMMTPSIIERVERPDGEVAQKFEPKVFQRVMSAGTARILARYMETTATHGTARRYFRGNGFEGVTVSGKTGTLSNPDPYLGFTWFVGFSSRATDGAKVAVSALACNTPLWQIKGGHAAAAAVREFYHAVDSKREVAVR